MRYVILCVLCLLTFISIVDAQVSETGLVFAEEGVMPGYVLFENRDGNILIDECGRVVNYWPNVERSRLHSKLLPNGHIIHISSQRSVVEYDWDGNVVARTFPNDSDITLDYEVIVLPNGNYLCVGRHRFSTDDFLNIGYTFNFGNRPDMVDVVIEMVPVTGEIVWEWNIADHVLQYRDSDAPNYANPAAHPELLDLDRISTYDWNFSESFMINGMDYNPELDQIALSVRKLSEVVIIDHSTTTEEAAGSTGGNSGKGGDILYRWGNPQNYWQGDITDRKLFFQHNPNWIKHGEWAGALMIYNNGLNRPNVTPESVYSEAVIIQPPVDENGQYTLVEGEAFAPTEANYSFGAPTGAPRFYSGYTSGARILPNGNTLITVGQSGRLLELRPDRSLAWAYNVPENGHIFRAVKYPADYPAFTDRDLTPGDPLSSATSTYECPLLVNTVEITSEESVSFSARYLAEAHQLRIENPDALQLTYRLFNLQGQMIFSGHTQDWSNTTQLPSLVSGIYTLQLLAPNEGQQQTIKLLVVR